MIVTDDFVMLNFPKTGSSFARESLKKLYRARRTTGKAVLEYLRLSPETPLELILPKIDEALDHNQSGQHGTRRQIPEQYRDRPVLTVVRNPLTRYDSLYRFRWWARYPPADIDEIRKDYPQFPDLSFFDYYQMNHKFGRANRLRGIVPKIEMGFQTIQFIQFYFEDPDWHLANIDEAYLEEERYRDQLKGIHFIHQENLNEELKDFLIEVGIPRKQLDFIDRMERVNVTDSPAPAGEQPADADNEVRNLILKHDRMIFKIFPEYLPSQSSTRN